MRIRSSRAWLALAVLGVSGCASLTHNQVKDSSVNMSHYRSYLWLTAPDANSMHLDNPVQIDYLTGNSTLQRDPDIEPALKESVDQKLTASGFVPAVAGPPDFYVSYFVRNPDGIWLSTWNGRVPSLNNVPLVMYPEFNQDLTREYREGDFLLVFYDAHTNRPVWTARLTDAYQGKKLDGQKLLPELGRLAGDFTRTAATATG